MADLMILHALKSGGVSIFDVTPVTCTPLPRACIRLDCGKNK